MLSLYTNTNKMLVQATDIDKQIWGGFMWLIFIFFFNFGNIRASLLLPKIQNQTRMPSEFFESGES